MAIQFTKIKQGRKRYIKTQAINDFSNWPTYLIELKALISRESALQIVDRLVFFEIESECQNPKIMLEVAGLPIPHGPFNLSIRDYEACDVLIHKLTGQDIFTMDYESLLETSRSLKRALEATFNKEQGKLSNIFHIVLSQDKIELHFFGQKDYIQNQC